MHREKRGDLPPIGGVIFDMDGTLTRTNELIFASFNHVAEKYSGRRFSPPEIIALFGPPEEGALRRIVGDDRVGAAMDDLCVFYRDNHAAMAGLHDGIAESLAFLKGRGVTLAVFTGKGRRTTLITLEALGIAGYFDIVVTGSDVAAHKPDPEGIRKILLACALDPAGVLMVGDTIHDIRAARDAGVIPVAVLWDSYDHERVLQAAPDYVFHSVPAMTAWLRTGVRFVEVGPKRDGTYDRERT